MKKPLFLVLVCVLSLAPFCVSLALWNSLPAVMATHWGLDGQPNGWMPRTMALLFLPVLDLVLAGIFLVIPLIDPLKKNIAEFRKHYDGFIIILLIFMLAVHCQTTLWSRGLRSDPLILLSPGMGILFFYTGVLLSKAKQNWFIGIRTPWTLSSPAVWTETHRIGAILFKILGSLFLVSILVRPYGLLVAVGLLLLAALFLVLYSYFLFRREQKSGA